MRIGIIGAGQLGQMLGFAARSLDIECLFLDPSDNPPAACCGRVIRRPFDDPAGLKELAAECDVVTYEFENVPVEALDNFGDVPVYPPATALRHSQDRLDEKQLFETLDVPLPGYARIDARGDLDQAASQLGLPMVVKTRRFGYDGKGQFVVRKSDDLDAAWRELGGQPLIAEQWVAFDYEVSCIGVRSTSGSVAIYPLARNLHRNGILRTSVSPLQSAGLAQQAAAYVAGLLDHLEYVGSIALELFVVGDQLLANEFAPRVHNSGHWSIEGSATSQFENHIRAIAGMPLGATDAIAHAGMVNLIGEIPELVRALDYGSLHDYGKSPRADRKLGHFTVIADTAQQRDALVEIIDKIVTQSAAPSENGA